MIQIEKSLETFNGKSTFDWFRSQKHLSIQKIISDGIQVLYEDFLNDLYDIYLKDRESEYFWFTNKGELVSNKGNKLISSDYIRINKKKLRDIKIEILINK